MTEPLIFEISSPGRRAVFLPELDVPEAKLPEELLRQVKPMNWARCFSSEKRRTSTISARMPAVMTAPKPLMVMMGLGTRSM